MRLGSRRTCISHHFKGGSGAENNSARSVQALATNQSIKQKPAHAQVGCACRR